EPLVLHALFGHFAIGLRNFIQLFLDDFFLFFLGFGFVILIFEFFLLLLHFLTLFGGHLETAAAAPVAFAGLRTSWTATSWLAAPWSACLGPRPSSSAGRRARRSAFAGRSALALF